jgi:hypothetical protein
VVAIFNGLQPKDFVVYHSEEELDNLIRGGYTVDCFQHKEKSQRFLLYLSVCYKLNYVRHPGACSSIVGLGTIVQAGSLWATFLMRSLGFSVDLILPAAF